MIKAIQIIIGGLLAGSVYAVIALGFSLVYRVTGVVNLAQGAFCIIGALLMYSFQVTLGWPLGLAAAASIAVTTAYGVVLGATTFVPSVSRLPSSSMLMVTVGLLTLTEGLALVIWGNEPFALPQFSGGAPIKVWGLDLVTQGFWIVGATLVVIVALRYLLMRTTLGQGLRACAENPTAARLMGISVPNMTVLSIGLAALIAAIGGIVVAPITSLEFDSGTYLTLSGFIAVAIGGLGSFAGAIAGGLILGVAEQLAAGYISSLFANSLAFALLFATLLWRPTGLFAAGAARRTDVREQNLVYRAVVRLKGKRGGLCGISFLSLVLALPFLLPAPGFLSSLVITMILFLGVIGLDVLMGFTGQVSLGQAGFMAIGGYTAAILATKYGISPLVGTLAGIVFSLACALALAAVTMHLRGHYLALATLTFGLLVDSLTVGLTNVTGGPSGLVGIPAFSIGPFSFEDPRLMYYFVVALALLSVLILLGGLRSSFGRALQAIRTDPMAAMALGVNVPLYKMGAFAISGVLASLAGSLYAFFFHFLSPEMVSTSRSFEMIAMLVIGGEGTLVGCLAGVALLTMLPTIFQPFALYKTLAEGLLLVLVFQYLPEGLYGTFIAWLSRFGGPAKTVPVRP